MKSVKGAAVILASTFVASALLSGCAQPHDNFANEVPKAAASGRLSPSANQVSESPSPAAALISGDVDGDGKITAWDLEQKAKTVYKMPDGTIVPIPSDQPLPLQVVAAVKEVMRPTQSSFANSPYGTAMAEADGEFSALMETQGEALNRVIIAVSYIRANRAWGVSDTAGGATTGQTKAEAVGYAKAFASASPSRYVVLIFD